MDRHETVERLAVHSAYGLHLVAKWMSARDDVDRALKERLAAHLMAIEGALGALGHTALQDEFEETEDKLHPR